MYASELNERIYNALNKDKRWFLLEILADCKITKRTWAKIFREYISIDKPLKRDMYPSIKPMEGLEKFEAKPRRWKDRHYCPIFDLNMETGKKELKHKGVRMSCPTYNTHLSGRSGIQDYVHEQ